MTPALPLYLVSLPHPQALSCGEWSKRDLLAALLGDWISTGCYWHAQIQGVCYLGRGNPAYTCLGRPGGTPDRHLPRTEEGHQRLNVAEKQG